MPRFRDMAVFMLVVVLLAGCETKPQLTAIDDNPEIIGVSSDDAEMNAAMDKARATLDQFVQAREKAGLDFDGLLKVYFCDEGIEDGEHMWVDVQSVSDGEFTGELLSEPGWLKSVKSGDIVTFGRDKVSDWLYSEDGKAIGAFTVNVLRSRMTDEERKQHDSFYPFSFD